MKTLYPRPALAALALANAIITSPAQAQTQETQQPPDSVVAVVADAQGLPFVPPEQRPFFGTFWEIRSSLPCVSAPVPFPPLDPSMPVYAIGDPVVGGQFLVDQTAGQIISPQAQQRRSALSTMDSAEILQAQVDELQNFIARVQARQADAQLRTNGQMGTFALDGQDGGPLEPQDGSGYPSNSLWLSISQITNGAAPLVIHGTVPDVLYEIWSKQTLTDTVWFLEGTVPGAADQDWTPTTVTVGLRTNSLFLRCRSWVSSNGSGIPDWWLLQYGLPLDTDPYSLCPSGDGWTLLQCWQNGWNPSVFYTPPPPQNVVARADGTLTNVTISWSSGGGPVTNYTIEVGTYNASGGQDFYPRDQVSPSTFSFTLAPDYPLTCTGYMQPCYRVRAYFSNGANAVSQGVPVCTPGATPAFSVVRGPGGHLYLAVSALPDSVTNIRLFDENGYNLWAGMDIPTANIVNGLVLLPDAQAQYLPSHNVGLQAFTASGGFGDSVGVQLSVATEAGYPDPLPLATASQHLKENLKFLLRSATVSQPFSYASSLSTDGQDSGGFGPARVWFPEDYFARPASPAAYEYYGFHVFSSNLNYSVMQELRPVQENYLWRNFVFDPQDYGLTGVDYLPADCPPTGMRGLVHPLHLCSGCDSGTNFPLAFTAASAQWLYFRPIRYDFCPSLQEAEVGVSTTSSNKLLLSASVQNCYGLSFSSVKLTSTGLPVLQPGTPSSFWQPDQTSYYPETAVPTLQTVDYYFASQTPYFNYLWHLDPVSWQYVGPAPPLPGSPTFSGSNTSPLLITGCGQPITVSGWAKQAIANGYSGKYAYLEQYFDKAYTIGPDGLATTNEAGLLSPYGEFLPMQPGPAALITMPDIDTGQQGTGVVYVAKLQCDVNRDGEMDLSFAGPDNTSQARPLLMWINNGHTEPGTGGNLDQDLSTWGNPPARPPNYSYGAIRCQRNLESFARLWICGVAPLLAGQGYSISLSMSPQTGNPALNLYWSCEGDGGTKYLTDTNTAALQVANIGGSGYGVSIGTVSNNHSYTFPDGTFALAGTQHLLLEGAGIGAGELVLTVSQGTNVLAQTSAWLDLRDVKDMFEHIHITGVTNTPPGSAFLASAYAEDNFVNASSGEDTNIVVFVHGWRMGEWDYENFSQTLFKRLYWQGYHGRFAAVRWPTLSEDDFWGPALGRDYFTYNSSEFRAWESAAGLSAYLTHLKQRFPGYSINVCAHSMGNVVMAEALKLQLAAGQQNVNNYVLMQAAVPASCYDTSFTNYAPFIAAEQQQQHTPNSYLGYPGAIGDAVSGRLVDFYNENDYALATGTLPWYGLWLAVSWEANQENFKPDAPLNYSTDGTSCFNYNMPITDSREIMSFCARPRSRAVGAQAGVGGAIQGGSVDLTASFGFYRDSTEHSAQFNWPIQRVGGFYHTLLNTLIPPGQ